MMETKNPPFVYRMCSLLAALPLLLCIFPCVLDAIFFVYSPVMYDECMREAGKTHASCVQEAVDVSKMVM